MALKKGEKYDAIIEAATKVIAKHGYYEAKVSQIAREAGLGDGTVYLYFKNKQDILISVLEEKMGSFISWLEERLKTRKTPQEKLYMLVDSHFRFLSGDLNLALVTQIELRQANKEIRSGIEPQIRRYYDVIMGVLEHGVDERVFYEDINKRIAANMIFGTLDEMVTSWVMSGGKYSLIDRVDTIYGLLTSGVMYESFDKKK